MCCSNNFTQNIFQQDFLSTKNSLKKINAIIGEKLTLV